MSHPARLLWQHIEPIHAVSYFASECRVAMKEVGLKGYWMGYFAGRAAPMGPVSPAVVVATFYNFKPELVYRAIPDAWALAPVSDILAARWASAALVLRRVYPAADAIAAAANPMLRAAVAAADVEGRPLAAANRDLTPPADPVAELWQHTATLREHRGDGHNALLTAAGISGCEAHVLNAAYRGVPREQLQQTRAWDDEDWAEAASDLRVRGWIDTAHELTELGRTHRGELEDRTDELAARPAAAVDVAALVGTLRPLVDAVITGGPLIFPNPIGLPKPG